jgi:hypothetical protein
MDKMADKLTDKLTHKLTHKLLDNKSAKVLAHSAKA